MDLHDGYYSLFQNYLDQWEHVCNIMKRCRLVQANALSPSVMLAWMPSADHTCLWDGEHAYLRGGKHACVQTMLYKHVFKYWWTILV